MLYVGISNAPAWVVARANTLAEMRGWSPLAGGILTEKYNRKGTGEEGRRRFTRENPRSKGALNDRNLAITAEVQQVAREVGKIPAQVALNWIRQQTGHGEIIPILGARTAEQARENLGSLDFQLSQEQVERLDAVSHVDLGYPHDFVRRGQPNPFLYGDKTIEDHRA